MIRYQTAYYEKTGMLIPNELAYTQNMGREGNNLDH